jgi:hypothetical protein
MTDGSKVSAHTYTGSKQPRNNSIAREITIVTLVQIRTEVPVAVASEEALALVPTEERRCPLPSTKPALMERSTKRATKDLCLSLIFRSL